MNLPQFLKHVDKAAEMLTREELAAFVHETARTLPEIKRDAFLERLKTLNKESKETVQEDIVSIEEVLKKLQLIEEGEMYLTGILNEEYDDWYDGPGEEFFFEDPDGLLDILENACVLVHEYIDHALYRESYQLFCRLLGLEITVDGEYADYCDCICSFEDLINENLLSLDYKQFILEGLYAAYQSFPLEERPEKLYNIIYNARCGNLTLEALMQKGEDDLQEVAEFLELWIAYLGEQTGGEAETFLKEALELQDDPEKSLKSARKYVKKHPEIFVQILQAGLKSGKAEELFTVGQEALQMIEAQYVIRSEAALLEAVYALRLNRQEDAEKCWLEAFRSDTRIVHYLRLLAESADFSKYRKDIKTHYEALNKTARKDSFSFDHQNIAVQNSIDSVTYNALSFFDGEFQRLITTSMNVKQPLGWSSTFMKCGIALFLLYLYEGEELPSGCGCMCRQAAESVYFSSEGYAKGVIGSVETNNSILFWECFCKWKNKLQTPDMDKETILQKLNDWIRKRTEAIVGGAHRNYYGECAAFIAALGEVSESRGERGQKQRLMESYKAEYPRHRAFHGELRVFGMNDPKKRK